MTLRQTLLQSQAEINFARLDRAAVRRQSDERLTAALADFELQRRRVLGQEVRLFGPAKTCTHLGSACQTSEWQDVCYCGRAVTIVWAGVVADEAFIEFKETPERIRRVLCGLDLSIVPLHEIRQTA